MNEVETPIFQSTEVKVNLDKKLVSMKDCPNKCIDGWIFNPYGHPKKYLCPYCEEKRRDMIHGGISADDKKPLSELLQIPDSFMNIHYDEEAIFPKFALKNLVPETVTGIKKELKQIIDDASIGEYPKYSILFNLGKKVNELLFIYPYLVRLYMAGVSVTPLITPIDICRLRGYAEQYGVQSENLSLTFYDLLDRDVCIISIDAGTMKNGFDAVKGLMQLRAKNGKPTIIFTNAWGRYVNDMCTEDGVKMLNLAVMYSVEYKDDERSKEVKNEQVQNTNTAQSRNTIGITSADFNKLLGR